MSSRRRVATTIAGMVLAIGLTACGGDDDAEQTDTGTTTGTTTGDTSPAETPTPVGSGTGGSATSTDGSPSSSSGGSSSTGGSSSSTGGSSVNTGPPTTDGMTDENMPGMDHSGGGH